MENYGMKIKVFRNNKGLTQSELADLLHVTPQAVSKWENNLSEPDLATFKRLAEVLDVSINDFLDTPKETPSNELNLGLCTVCHKPYGFDGLLKTDSGLVCHDCIKEREAKEKQEAIKKLNDEKKIADKEKERKQILIRFIIGAVIGVLGLILFIISAATAEPNPDITKRELMITSIVLGLMFLTFITQMIYNSWLREMLVGYIGKTYRMPGIIFNLSISGVVWLIIVKILFALIGILLSLIVFLFGLALTFVISPITYIIDFILFLRGKELL